MKKMMLLLLTLLIWNVASVNAQVTIGADSDPDPSAVLDLKTTNQGLLLPRVSLSSASDVRKIPHPVIGLTVYDTNTNQLAVWNGSSWKYMGESNKSEGSITITREPAIFTFVERPGTDANPTLALSVTTTTRNIACTYQWYSKKVNAKNTEDFAPISEATASSYTPTADASTVGLYRYFCRINQGIYTLDSDSSEVAYGCGARTVFGGWLSFMCYNLGAEAWTIAEQLAYQPEPDTAPLDAKVNGDLYQWGRKTDGHEKRNSETTATLATNDAATTPADVAGKFIVTTEDPYNWRSGGINNVLWGDGSDQGGKPDGIFPVVKGVNDPCPDGWMVPSSEQWSIISGGDNNNMEIPAPGFNNANYWFWSQRGNERGWMISPDQGSTYTLYLKLSGRRDRNGDLVEYTQGRFHTSNQYAPNWARYLTTVPPAYSPWVGGTFDAGRTVRCVAMSD
jgi:hypothetical protein